eukprot:6670180-Prymnesium_polylepis.1
MEGEGGSQCIIRLNEGSSGLHISSFVSDLDSKVNAHVRRKCEEAGQEKPEQLFDPGHWKK